MVMVKIYGQRNVTSSLAPCSGCLASQAIGKHHHHVLPPDRHSGVAAPRRCARVAAVSGKRWTGCRWQLLKERKREREEEKQTRVAMSRLMMMMVVFLLSLSHTQASTDTDQAKVLFGSLYGRLKDLIALLGR